MKVIVSQKNLKKALNIVEKIINKNNSLPILNNILLKTENGRLRLISTNLEIGIKYIIGAKVDEVGEIAVPARIISDFVNNISDEKTYLTTKNNILYVNSDKYKTQILGFNTKDFPIIPKIKNNPFCSIPVKILRNCLLSILDSVAISEVRPELSGVFIDFSNNKISFAATDSFRLTEKIIGFKNKESKSIILPRNTIMELIKISNDIEGDLSLRIGDNQISFYNNDIELISRLIDGNYPDYKKIIPEKFITKVLIKKEDLEKNIRLASIFSSNIADIKMVFMDKKLNIIAKNSDKGEIQTSVNINLKNQPFNISVNYNYLLDGLKIIPTDNVVIEYTGQGSPLVLKPEDESGNLFYLIMPLRS